MERGKGGRSVKMQFWKYSRSLYLRHFLRRLFFVLNLENPRTLNPGTTLNGPKKYILPHPRLKNDWWCCRYSSSMMWTRNRGRLWAKVGRAPEVRWRAEWPQTPKSHNLPSSSTVRPASGGPGPSSSLTWSLIRWNECSKSPTAFYRLPPGKVGEQHVPN